MIRYKYIDCITDEEFTDTGFKFEPTMLEWNSLYLRCRNPDRFKDLNKFINLEILTIGTDFGFAQKGEISDLPKLKRLEIRGYKGELTLKNLPKFETIIIYGLLILNLDFSSPIKEIILDRGYIKFPKIREIFLRNKIKLCWIDYFYQRTNKDSLNRFSYLAQ